MQARVHGQSLQPVSDKPDKPPKDYSRKTAKAKPLTFKVTASAPAVADAETLPVVEPLTAQESSKGKSETRGDDEG